MRARKPNDLGGSPSSGRIGLAVLLATVAAFLLIPVAQAAAGGTFKVNIIGTGSGTVESEIEGLGNPTGSPKIECSYASPGPATGVCENEMFTEGGGNDVAYTISKAAAGSEVFTITVDQGTDRTNEAFGPGYDCAGEGQEELEGFFGGWVCIIEGEAAEAGGEVTVCFVLEGEGEAGCGGPPPPTDLKVNIESGEGSVVSSPAGIECPSECEAFFAKETKVTLTASPAPGYVFKSWKKCDSGGVNGRQCTVTITNEEELKEVGANFIPVWALTISKAEGSGTGSAKSKPGGIVCGYNCTTSTAVFKEGKPVEIITKPYKHFHLVEFKNGTGQTAACNGNTSCSYEPGGEDSSTEVLFAEDTKYALSLSKTGGGQAFLKTKPTGIICGFTCGEAEAEYYEGEVLEVSVKLNKGTTSLEWTSGAGTCTGTIETVEATCSVTMSEAHELVADLQ